MNCPLRLERIGACLGAETCVFVDVGMLGEGPCYHTHQLNRRTEV